MFLLAPIVESDGACSFTPTWRSDLLKLFSAPLVHYLNAIGELMPFMLRLVLNISYFSAPRINPQFPCTTGAVRMTPHLRPHKFSFFYQLESARMLCNHLIIPIARNWGAAAATRRPSAA